MSAFNYSFPGDIDGTPREVRDAVLLDLERLGDFVEAYTDSARRQLLNAGLTEAVENGAPGTPNGATELYIRLRPKEARLVDQLSGRGARLGSYLRTLVRNTREYDEERGA